MKKLVIGSCAVATILFLIFASSIFPDFSKRDSEPGSDPVKAIDSDSAKSDILVAETPVELEQQSTILDNRIAALEVEIRRTELNLQKMQEGLRDISDTATIEAEIATLQAGLQALPSGSELLDPLTAQSGRPSTPEVPLRQTEVWNRVVDTFGTVTGASSDSLKSLFINK